MKQEYILFAESHDHKEKEYNEKMRNVDQYKDWRTNYWILTQNNESRYHFGAICSYILHQNQMW